MYKNDKLLKNKLYRKSVNNEPELKYQKKIPKNSRVFIKNKSHDKFKNDTATNDFKSIMKKMYSEIDNNALLKTENNDINNIDFMSPIKNINYKINPKQEKSISRKKLFPSYSQRNYNLEKTKDRLSLKRVKLNKEKEEILSPFHDYSNQLMDRFTQISIIRPNRNEIFLEQSSDTDRQNDEYVYFYEPKKGLRLELGNSSKREIKSIFENVFMDSKLVPKNEIDFSIDDFIDEDKMKYNLKYKDLIKKEELYDNLIIKYNLLLKELTEIKNKNTISSDSGKGEEKRIQHLEDIIIIKNYTNNTKELINRTKRPKMKKVKRKRIKSLTPIKNNYSSSDEPKTRDNSQNAFGSSNSNVLLKNKNNKCIPNIMIISKENEFNLAASYKKLIENNNNIPNKTKKKIKKIINKVNNKNDWNLSNKVLNNICFTYSANRKNDKKNNKIKKRVLKVKERKKEIEKKDKSRGASNSSHRKIKKLNIPIINIKNETLSYNIKKKYIRFKTEAKSIDVKTQKNNIKNNQNLFNNNFIHCHSESLSLGKSKKTIKKDDIIVKNINLNIIKNQNQNNRNELKQDQNKSIENNSENKEFSYFSSEIKEKSDYYSEDEKIKMKNKIENYNENKNKNNEIENMKKDKKYTFKIKIVKFIKKKKNHHIYFDALFKDLINKILFKRIFKKWVKLSKK